MVVELRPHQQKAVDELGNGKILYGGVGVGKSITACAYFVSKVCGGTYGDYGSMRTPMDVVVITTAKKRDSLDWEEEFNRFKISPNPQHSMDGIMLTVDSWNNIKDYENDTGKFFIFDEQRVVGYGAWSKAFIKIAKANQFILLSATPGDTWLDYIPIFIANGWYKNKTDFINQHVIWTPRVKYPKVQRYIATGKLVRRRNEVLVHMPYVRTTKRHPIDIVCSFDEAAFKKVVDKKWHVFEKRPLRDVAELFSVMRKVVNSDSSRLAAVRSLMEEHPRLIVFYNFDYELEMLRTLIPPDQLASPESIEQLKASLDTSPRSRRKSSKSSSGSRSTTGSGTTSAPGTETSANYCPLGEPHDESCVVEEEPWETPATPPDAGDKTPTAGTEGRPIESSTSSTSTSTRSDGSRRPPLGIPVTLLTSTDSSTPTAACSQPGLHPTSTEHSSDSHSSDPLPSSTSLRKSSPTSGTSTTGAATTPAAATFAGTDAPSVSPLPATIHSGTTTTDPRPEVSGDFAVAEWNGHKHEQIPATARWVYLVQYRAGAEGWNCVSTNAMVFYSQTYSYRDWWQAHGRIDRMNTLFTDLYYYHLISDSIIDKAIRKALQTKRSFNERSLRVSTPF